MCIVQKSLTVATSLGKSYRDCQALDIMLTFESCKLYSRVLNPGK